MATATIEPQPESKGVITPLGVIASKFASACKPATASGLQKKKTTWGSSL